jgi:ActR/RegA family two-component response regulator
MHPSTLESARKQMPDYLVPPVKVDRVGGLQLIHPLRKVALGRRRDQMKMILLQDITMHSHPVALCPFSEIA